MATLDKTALIAKIDSDITTNANNEITGAILNALLKDIGDSYPNKIDERHLLGVADYDATKTYNANAEGVVVVYEGLLYQAVTTSISGAFDPTKWKVIGGSGWIKVSKTHNDFQAASTTNDIEIYSLPAGWALEGVVIKHSTSASGGSISAYTISLGVTGNLDKFVFDPLDVFQATSGTAFEASVGFNLMNWDSATSIRSQAVSTGDDLDQSTAGEWEYYLKVSQVKI